MRSLMFLFALIVVIGVVSADCEGSCRGFCKILCRIFGSTCEESHCENDLCFANCTDGHKQSIGHDEMMKFKIQN